MANSAKLNRNIPYLLVRGDEKAKFMQDGKYYDFFGKLCGEVPNAFQSSKPEPIKKAISKSQAKRKAALSRASDSLGDLGVTRVGAVPQEVEDAAKENAKALAAEDNA